MIVTTSWKVWSCDYILDHVVRVQALAEATVLHFWARHFTPTVPPIHLGLRDQQKLCLQSESPPRCINCACTVRLTLRWNLTVLLVSLMLCRLENGPGVRFSKAPVTFQACKAIAKSWTLQLQSCFIHVFLIWGEFPFIQEVSGAYTSPFLDTDGLKMALRVQKVSGAFVKRAPEPF